MEEKLQIVLKEYIKDCLNNMINIILSYPQMNLLNLIFQQNMTH